MLDFPLKVTSAPIYAPYKPKFHLFSRKLEVGTPSLQFEVLMDDIHGPVGYMTDRYIVKLSGKPAEWFKNVKPGQMLRFFGRSNKKYQEYSKNLPTLEVIFLKYGESNFSEEARELIRMWSKEQRDFNE